MGSSEPYSHTRIPNHFTNNRSLWLILCVVNVMCFLRNTHKMLSTCYFEFSHFYFPFKYIKVKTYKGACHFHDDFRKAFKSEGDGGKEGVAVPWIIEPIRKSGKDDVSNPLPPNPFSRKYSRDVISVAIYSLQNFGMVLIFFKINKNVKWWAKIVWGTILSV